MNNSKRWITSLLLGPAFAISLAARSFQLFERARADQALLLAVPAIGFGILIFLVFPFFESRNQKTFGRMLIVTQSLLAAAFVMLGSDQPALGRAADFVTAAGLASGFLLAAAPGLDTTLEKNARLELLAGWLAGLPPALMWAGYVSHFYPSWLAPLIGLLGLTIFGSAGCLLIHHVRRVPVGLLSLLTVSAAFVFALAVIALCLGYPNLFDRERFLPVPALANLFWPLALLAPASIAWTLQALETRGLADRPRVRGLAVFLLENLPGIALGAAFFLAYTALGQVFNRPGVDLTENFFAADNFAWILRFAAPSVAETEMRAVHPFAYFIFRPAVWLLAFLFNGDRLAAALLLVPLTGGLCVFMAWRYIKRITGSRTYALLTASLLGVSTSHLLFASIVESYIFSAAALLLFFLLLASGKTSLPTLAAAATITFGITITNFIQTFIGFALARPKLKAIIAFGLLVSAASITLTALHAAFYPAARVFFLPADAAVEGEYSFAILGQDAWRLTGRALLLVRNIFFYSLAAPRPFILTEEVGGVFPRFNFFKLTPGTFHYSGYEGLGQILAAAWALLLLGAGAAFLWNLARARNADGLPFLLCLAFNFVLHMGYGYEPFLYSANWTYALVLFTALALARFAGQRRFQAALLIFLGLLMINQWLFLQLIFRNISPFL